MHGLQGLTVDAVVADARVSKGTVYRWWDSKHALAMDAILRIFNEELDIPDTGSVIEDFRFFMKQFTEVLQRGGLGYTYVSLLMEAQQDRRIEDLHQRCFYKRRKVLYKIIQRGIERGELKSQLDRDLIVDQLFGSIVFRLLTSMGAIDDAMIDGLLITVSDGLAHTGGHTA